MDEFDRKIAEALHRTGDYDAARASRIGENVEMAYQKNVTYASRLAWLAIIVLNVLAIPFIMLFFSTDSVRMMIFCAAVVILLTLYEILMKLWYWVFWSRFRVGLEVKELQHMVAELSEKLEVREKEA